MGLKLQILEWWTPKFIIRRELANVSDQTTTALQSLIDQYATQDSASDFTHSWVKNIEAQRANMAQTHVKLVEDLKLAVGYEKAVALGREALFSAGKHLGEQTRLKLGVGDKPEDLIKAAKILYRILGIEFHLEQFDNASAVAIIDRCALAKYYTPLTCTILSATDEGVIAGLQPNTCMHFKEFMTSGCQTCLAKIKFMGKEEMC